MKFTIQRETLLKPLQLLASIIERRQTQPLLANVLLRATENGLALIGTDLEVELISELKLEGAVTPGQTTVSARKLMDICRNLAEQATLEITTQDQMLLIKSQRSRFNLATLPAESFPYFEPHSEYLELSLAQNTLKDLIEHISFAIAQQDIRYYLNGMLLEFEQGQMRALASDGHRLAMNTLQAATIDCAKQQALIPRKAISELTRLLENNDSLVQLRISKSTFQLQTEGYTFSSKLIDSRYPDYQKVIPRQGDKIVVLDRELFRQALTRVAILSSEKYRGIRLLLQAGLLRLLANNTEQDEAEEELAVAYEGPELEMGFNVNYLLDVMTHIPSESIQMIFSDAAGSVLIKTINSEHLYVIMPMRV